MLKLYCLFESGENMDKKKPIINLIYSVLGLVVFNGIIQFVLYPFLNRKLGDDSFGIVLSLLSVLSIISCSIGCAVNNTRMVFVNEDKSENGDYNIIILVFNIIGIFVITIFLAFFKQLSFLNVIFLNILMFLTSFRYYADVEFRKNLKYLSFLIYYVLIGVGYALGCLLYYVFPVWEVSMITGELLALSYVLFKGNIFKGFFKTSEHRKKIFLLCISFFIGELINTLILNADRIILQLMCGGSDVTTYYVASLVGKIVALVTVPLTGVIMGYLSRFKGVFSKKMLLIYVSVDIILGICALGGCLIISPFLISKLYPQVSSAALEILFYATASSVLFFISNLLVILVLRYKNSNVQLIMNILHLIIFVAITIPFTYYRGLEGFSIGALIGNGIKFLIVLFYLLFNKLDDTRDGYKDNSSEIEESL